MIVSRFEICSSLISWLRQIFRYVHDPVSSNVFSMEYRSFGMDDEAQTLGPAASRYSFAKATQLVETIAFSQILRNCLILCPAKFEVSRRSWRCEWLLLPKPRSCGLTVWADVRLEERMLAVPIWQAQGISQAITALLRQLYSRLKELSSQSLILTGCMNSGEFPYYQLVPSQATTCTGWSMQNTIAKASIGLNVWYIEIFLYVLLHTYLYRPDMFQYSDQAFLLEVVHVPRKSLDYSHIFWPRKCLGSLVLLANPIIERSLRRIWQFI